MFSENLKNLRLQSGLNKKQAAVLLNLPYTTYNNYETGSREPNSEVLVKIANTFHVSTDFLLDNLSFKGKNMFLTEEEQSIIAKYRDLPKGIQSAVKQMVETTHCCWQEKENVARDPEGAAVDMESPATVYRSGLTCEVPAHNIVAAAYGEGMYMHPFPAERQEELEKAQRELHIDLEIAKRRELYGK